MVVLLDETFTICSLSVSLFELLVTMCVLPNPPFLLPFPLFAASVFPFFYSIEYLYNSMQFKST